jgi:hypothetical protein
MAVMVATDLGLFFSGGASKANAEGQQGGAISSVQITEQTIENITAVNTFWNDVAHTDRLAGVIQYRCFYIKNKHATETARNIKLYKDVTGATPDTINLGYSGNTPNTPEQTLTVSNTLIYTCPLTTSQVNLDDTRYGQGESPLTNASPIFNKPIAVAKFYLRRVGNPTGNIRCAQWAFTDGTMSSPLATIASIPASDIPTTNPPVMTTFTATPGQERGLQVNDVLAVDSKVCDSNDYIEVYRNATDPIPNTRECRNDTDSWGNVSSYDIAGEFYTTGTAGDRTAPNSPAITFSNPNTLETAIALPDLAPGAYVGFWEQRIVPANCAASTSDISQLCIVFESPDA